MNVKNFCIKKNFGNHSLLYGAEIDGIFSQQPITETFIGKLSEFIELKTKFSMQIICIMKIKILMVKLLPKQYQCGGAKVTWRT